LAQLAREETLHGVNVRAADAGGVDRHHYLARSSGGLGRFVYGEHALAAPGRYLHVGMLTRESTIRASMSDCKT